MEKDKQGASGLRRFTKNRGYWGTLPGAVRQGLEETGSISGIAATVAEIGTAGRKSVVIKPQSR
ncbi:MAG: hypothetical protein ABSE17_02690 [Candidatus Levyibacteriota bacterium]|jgi:hypothetical protein